MRYACRSTISLMATYSSPKRRPSSPVILIAGQLAELMERIAARKNAHKIVTAGLVTNTNGKRLTPAVLRYHFHKARKLGAEAHPEMAAAINAFHFYELRGRLPTTPATSAASWPRATCLSTAMSKPRSGTIYAGAKLSGQLNSCSVSLQGRQLSEKISLGRWDRCSDADRIWHHMFRPDIFFPCWPVFDNSFSFF